MAEFVSSTKSNSLKQTIQLNEIQKIREEVKQFKETYSPPEIPDVASGTKWFVSDYNEFVDYTDVVGMKEGDIFLYPQNGAMFTYTGGQWVYKNSIMIPTTDADIDVTDSGNLFSSQKLDGVLSELFTFANNGKTDIASVVGSPALNGDTFSQLKTHIQNGKNKLATNLTAKGQTAVGTESLDSLAGKVSSITTDAGGFKTVKGTVVHSVSGDFTFSVPLLNVKTLILMYKSYTSTNQFMLHVINFNNFPDYSQVNNHYALYRGSGSVTVTIRTATKVEVGNETRITLSSATLWNPTQTYDYIASQ